MAQRRRAERPRQQAPSLADHLKTDAAVLAGLGSTFIAYAFQEALFTGLQANHYLTALKFVWLFGVMLWCAFNVVRHADAIASLLGEPYGTLVLTLSAIVIEVALIASIMLHGANNPTLARDAMFATLMIVLNGMVGTALLIGALRYSQQDYNLEGARAFLVVIAALAVFALVLPAYTKTAPDPSIAPGQAILFGAITLLFYAVFLAIQTSRHRAFFDEPNRTDAQLRREAHAIQRGPATGSLTYHVVMLLLSLLPVVLLSEFLATIVDLGIEDLKLPEALGGVLIAIIVLSPEGLTAFHAALANHLQRAVNVCLGSALATIGLTIPAVLAIGLFTGNNVQLGLSNVEIVLLVLTLFVSALTFGGTRTSVLQGLVHLLLFVVYLAMIFSP